MPKIEKWWHKDPDSHRLGIGVILHWKPTGWVVDRTLLGSPAEKAGIKPGDVIVSLNEFGLGAREDIRESWMHKESPFRISLMRGGSEQAAQSIEAKTLRELFDEEEKLGGSLVGCYTCYDCYDTSNGYRQCGEGGCSGECASA
ncbi:MAG: PDZ domain-containing protein [Candidatus Obscuribacterales bacterium]|nr:PDZ domain-containing protein [Candidatus Obscuribacterales bacterium]